MQKFGTFSVTLGILLSFSALLSFACASTRCERRFESPQVTPVFTVHHASGGLAPVIRSFYLYSGGYIGLGNARGNLRCARLTERDSELLANYVHSSSFQAQLAEARGKGARTSADSSEIQITLEGLTVAHVSAEPVPPDLLPLLRKVNGVIAKYFGEGGKLPVGRAD